MDKKTILAVLGTIILIFIGIGTFGIRLLYQHGCFARLVPVDNPDTIKIMFDKTGLKELATRFQSNDPRVLLRQVMNTVSKVEPSQYRNAMDIYRKALDGKGTLCDGMAELYYSVLRINGIKARQVYLKKNLYDIYDTHSTVEVFFNGKWVIFDPTFHVSFVKNGQLIGAKEIQESLFNGSGNNIKPVFYGPVKYPARIETYYMNWLPLFNNVFFYSNREVSWWSDIPPNNYWSNILYYHKIPGYSDFHVQFHNQLFFMLEVVIPVLIYGTVVLFGLILTVMMKTKIIRGFGIKNHNQ